MRNLVFLVGLPGVGKNTVAGYFEASGGYETLNPDLQIWDMVWNLTGMSEAAMRANGVTTDAIIDSLSEALGMNVKHSYIARQVDRYEVTDFVIPGVESVGAYEELRIAFSQYRPTFIFVGREFITFKNRENRGAMIFEDFMAEEDVLRIRNDGDFADLLAATQDVVEEHGLWS